MSETIASTTLNEQPKATTSSISQRPGYRAVLGRTFAHIRAAAPGLSVGERAPDFTLPDQLGRPVSLAERRAAGPVVIAFYRGDWCPHCNVMLRAMNAHLDRIRELGASLLAISPQAPDHALSLTEKHALGFEVLSDERQEVITAYRLSYETPVEQQELVLDALDLDLTKENADGTWNLPATATFVIDREGTIVAGEVTANPAERMAPDAVLAALHASSYDT